MQLVHRITVVAAALWTEASYWRYDHHGVRRTESECRLLRRYIDKHQQASVAIDEQFPIRSKHSRYQ